MAFALALLALSPSYALSKERSSARTREAVGVSAAHRAVERLEKQLSEARHVRSATRTYSERFGSSVGRWVWLARDTGWKWADLDQLMYVVFRESRGNPKAKNPVSTASGLLQFLAFWWDGSGGYGWKFDPFDPRKNLYYGHRAFLKQGWGPWLL